MPARYRLLIPTLVAAVACLVTFVTVALGLTTADGYAYALSWQHYSGLAAVLFLLGSFFWQPRLYPYVLLGCCILAIAGIIRLLLVHTTFNLGVGEAGISLSVDGMLLGLLTYALNHRRINSRLEQIIGPGERQRTASYQQAVAGFKARFQQKSTAELNRSLTNPTLMPAALDAVRQLLAQRQQTGRDA